MRAKRDCEAEDNIFFRSLQPQRPVKQGAWRLASVWRHNATSILLRDIMNVKLNLRKK